MKIFGKVVIWTVVAAISGFSLLVLSDSFYERSCFERPSPGTVISVPGERMVVLDPETIDGEEALVLDVVREPFEDRDYSLPPEHGHFHPNQVERFEVVDGRARFLIGDQYVDLGPGETGIVPPNTNHHWMALDGQPVRAKTYFEPSLDVDMWFLHFQKHVSAGDMDLLQAAVISREYAQGSPAPANPPPVVWNVMSRALAPIGRIFGYKAC